MASTPHNKALLVKTLMDFLSDQEDDPIELPPILPDVTFPPIAAPRRSLGDAFENSPSPLRRRKQSLAKKLSYRLKDRDDFSTEEVPASPSVMHTWCDALTLTTRALQNVHKELLIHNQLLELQRKAEMGEMEKVLWKRSDKVNVYLKLTFLRVIDVLTIEQHFSADIYLQARWEEPALKGKTQKQLDKLDLKPYWGPDLEVTNIEGELDESVQVTLATAEELGFSLPVMTYRRRMRGKFKEVLELKNFPIDAQELTISVSSEKAGTEVELLEDPYDISGVDTEAFQDEQEWTIYEHVNANPREPKNDALKSRYKNATVDFQCHISRRPMYFLWNNVLIVFMITFMTFIGYVIDVSDSGTRIEVVLTLILTSVAFKLVVAHHLPTISYLTYLDIYVLVSMLFMMLQTIIMSIMGVLASKEDADLPYIRKVETIIVILSIALLFLFNFGYCVYIAFATRVRRRLLKTMEAAYQEKKRKMEEKKCAKTDTNSNSKKPKIAKIHPMEDEKDETADNKEDCKQPNGCL